MKKIILLMPVFFLFNIISCQTSVSDNEKIITLTLPQWPPEDKCKNLYPQLSKWKITIRSGEQNSTFYYPPATLTITLKAIENQPVAVTVTPVTKGPSGENIIFFKPAGYISPYNKENKLTWNEGFLSSIMISLFNSSTASNKDTENFISCFNWKKASEIINSKINDLDNSYNPWLLNRESILEKISEKKFSAAYLNLSSIYLFCPEDNNKKYLSSFITANNFSPFLILKKSQPQQFMTSSSTGVTITYISSKNVSLDHCFLPILIEGL